MADTNEEEEERVTAHSYGALDTSQAPDQCWLLRVPTKLAELWQKAPEGTDLGELVFTKGGKSASGAVVKPSFIVQVSPELVESIEPDKASAMPLNYSLQAMTKKVPTMHPFTRNPNNGSVKILGNVTRTANLQVEQDNAYRAMLKDRLVATNITSSRYVKPVEATESIIHKHKSTTTVATATNTQSKTFGNAVLKFGKRMLEASQQESLPDQGGPATKKGRQFAPDQPLRSVIFELFGQQQYWTVKDLKAAAVSGGCSAAGTKKAESEMREILREIGDYHRSGDHKNMWELRKEFQQQT